MSLEAGRVLSERYRLVRPLGQGSQGAVWIADHLALNTHVAVKLIDPELAKREDARERFKREATAAAQLRSAHVVQILDHGIAEGQPFIVMELLEGEDLFERLNKRGRLSLRETSRIITQVCRALARAHAASIVHRDLKPENVFLCNNEDDEVVKVLDFGVAKVTDPAKATMQRTNVGTLIGTPHYMSPEQVKGVSEIDHRTDLWAIGVIAYQCVVGDLPFDSEGVGDLLIKISVADPPIPSKVFPGVPAAFDAWFAKACDRSPDKRFQSARELAEALARVVASVPEAMRGELPPRPASIRPPPVTPQPPRSTKGAAPPPLPPTSTRTPKPPQAAPSKPQVAAKPDEGDDAPTRMRIPVPEDIDDFEFDFDDEPPIQVTTGTPSAPVAPAPKPSAPAAAATRKTPTPAPAPAPAQRTSAVPPQPRQTSPGQTATATPTPQHSDLGAPVLPPGLLDAPAPARAQTAQPAPVQQPQMPAQRAAAYAAPTTAPGIDSGDRVSPPPELDGSRRRRTLVFVGVLFVAAAAGIAWMVIHSNMPPPEPTPAASAPTVQGPELPQVVEVPAPTTSFGTPVPTTKKGVKVGPGATTKTTKTTTKSTTKTTKKVDDGTIEVPDPAGEEHSPEPAPAPPQGGGDDGTVPPAP